MRTSFNKVCESAFVDHGINFFCFGDPSRSQSAVHKGKRVEMLKHETKSGWVGVFREDGGVSGDLLHRVRGAKGQVAEWLVRALVDGPSAEDAVSLKVEYEVSRMKYGASLPGRTSKGI